MEQRPSETPRPKREFLVVLFGGGALLVVGCLLPFYELPFPGPFRGNFKNVSGYETDLGKVLLGMGVVLIGCSAALWWERPKIRELVAALAAAVAVGAALIAVTALTGDPSPPVEGFQGFAIGRPAAGHYLALAGAFTAVASAALVARDALRAH